MDYTVDAVDGRMGDGGDFSADDGGKPFSTHSVGGGADLCRIFDHLFSHEPLAGNPLCDLVWDAVLIALGAAAGSSWQLAAKQFDYQSAVLLMVLFKLVVSILPFYLLKRKRRQRRGE